MELLRPWDSVEAVQMLDAAVWEGTTQGIPQTPTFKLLHSTGPDLFVSTHLWSLLATLHFLLRMDKLQKKGIERRNNAGWT